MQPKRSQLCPQKPDIGPYPDPVKSSSIVYYSPNLRQGLSIGFFSSGIPTVILYAFLVYLIAWNMSRELIYLSILILFG
jgi:hypothetical protein